MFGGRSDGVSLIRIEEEVRRYWRRHQVAAAFRAAHRDGPPYLVCQQPLAAAGQSWADQIRLWATADLLARYQAMRGRDVRHQTGWSCHGLPVEIAVEQALGPDLADYDLAQFNAACHETAVSGVTQGQDLAEWLGVWPDPDAALVTLSPQSVGAVWGALKKLWAAGRLKQERRVVPFCPRCATPLSTTEAARRAVTTEGRWVWVRLPWDGQPDTYLLVWTPAPWTLVSMVALAVHPEATYVLVEHHSRGRVPPTRLLLAEAALNRTTGGAPTILRRLPGKALRGTRYHPPFTFVPASGGSGQILVSPEVPLERGTGLLPVTPTFDSLSLSLAQAHGLPVPDVLDDFGSLDDAVTPWRGLSPLDAEPLLVEDLQSRGLLLRQETREQQRALCP
jgi:isoleucyl-tRNA synthetase